MPVNLTQEERAQLKRHVDTWRGAAVALEEIRVRELQALDTRRAIHDLYGSSWMPPRDPEREATSGLVEQQAWFAKLRR